MRGQADTPKPPEGSLTVTEALLRPLLDSDPGGPRITFYRDITAERVELSTLTLANWAAKTANFLRDELGVNAGDPVSVALPAHWQTAAVLLGAWWAGAEVCLDPAAHADARVGITTLGGADAFPAADELAIVSLHPMGLGLPAGALPIGMTDWASASRLHGDAFYPSAINSSPGAGPAAALDGEATAAVLAAARGAAEAAGIARGDRVHSTGNWDDANSLIGTLLAVLAAGASLVQVDGDADNSARAATEKITKWL